MKPIKAIAVYLAAEILCLFIGLTLAGSSNPVIRLISAVCTTGILVCLLASFALTTAKEDAKQERITGQSIPGYEPYLSGAAASAPALISWIILFATHSGGGVDFYRWHKIINGPFLQIYNLINSDASSAALTQGQILVMLPLIVIPAAAVIIPYLYSYRKEKSPEK